MILRNWFNCKNPNKPLLFSHSRFIALEFLSSDAPKSSKPSSPRSERLQILFSLRSPFHHPLERPWRKEVLQGHWKCFEVIVAATPLELQRSGQGVDVALLERAAEVVFFTPYALPGLAFPLSSFMLVLEAYWLRMAHLSPHLRLPVWNVRLHLSVTDVIPLILHAAFIRPEQSHGRLLLAAAGRVHGVASGANGVLKELVGGGALNGLMVTDSWLPATEDCSPAATVERCLVVHRHINDAMRGPDFQIKSVQQQNVDNLTSHQYKYVSSVFIQRKFFTYRFPHSIKYLLGSDQSDLNLGNRRPKKLLSHLSTLQSLRISYSGCVPIHDFFWGRQKSVTQTRNTLTLFLRKRVIRHGIELTLWKN
jgi:hypothetical protein